jgi:hypothetical protein
MLGRTRLRRIGEGTDRLRIARIDGASRGGGRIPVSRRKLWAERITATAEGTPIAAFIDLVGREYVELALAATRRRPRGIH